MKVALIGYGKMGQAIDTVAVEKGMEVVARVDSCGELDSDAVAAADVCIEFTQPDAVVGNVRTLTQMGKPIVIGTTGWYEHLDEVEAIALDSQVGVVYASNFSIGVYLFEQIVASAAHLLNPFVDPTALYDVALSEIHHRQKKDSPSGTALTLAEILLTGIDGKEEAVADIDELREDGEGGCDPKKLLISSTRVGHVPGTHAVSFDSPYDTLTLTHTARSRLAFAYGALRAARWVVGRVGCFNIDAMMEAL